MINLKFCTVLTSWFALFVRWTVGGVRSHDSCWVIRSCSAGLSLTDLSSEDHCRVQFQVGICVTLLSRFFLYKQANHVTLCFMVWLLVCSNGIPYNALSAIVPKRNYSFWIICTCQFIQYAIIDLSVSTGIFAFFLLPSFVIIIDLAAVRK
jgi:hypothetical protein